MFRTPILLLSMLIATAACDPEAAAPVDLQSASAVHYDDRGAPLYRVEATFVGAERHAEVEALINAVSIQPSDAAPDAVAERASKVTQRLAQEGGDAILIEVHPLRAEDQGQSFSYTVGIHGQVAPQSEAPVGLMTQESALRLSSGAIRLHDLWCYVFHVRWRTNSGSGFYAVNGPIGFVPLPEGPRGVWLEMWFSLPSPWPYPWFAMVQNPNRQTLDYDLRVRCEG